MSEPKIGPLLSQTLDRIERGSVERSLEPADSESQEPVLPVVAQLNPTRPEIGEAWDSYRARVADRLGPVIARLESSLGVHAAPLITANALQMELSRRQVTQLVAEEDLELLELDPLVQVVQMDDAVEDLDLDHFMSTNPGLDGSGVKVAVLDSGVDIEHPDLVVADSVSTSGESVDIPGSHGTHCAGSIASRDAIFPGVAPGVTLINVKVLFANGKGRHTTITKGIDEALDRGAQVLSMSLGFNHLPTWSDGGHGWSCPDGRCPLCTAVDNASNLDNAVVVVAAGNEHHRAQALQPVRRWPSWLDWLLGKPKLPYDTELGCPGQARQAITVGAMTKNTFNPAYFTSHGPTAYGTTKPDISAPGVNITSTIPLPRDAGGQVVPNTPQNKRFGRKSGTSMATPIVAGAVALMVQKAQLAGTTWTPASIKSALKTGGVILVSFPQNVAGAGRLNLRNL